MSNTYVKPIPTLEMLRRARGDILKLAERHGAFNVRVFGSVARGEATIESDVDILVDFHDGATIWDAVGLWQDLQEYLGLDVSLTTQDDPDKPFMQRILKDAVPL